MRLADLIAEAGLRQSGLLSGAHGDTGAEVRSVVMDSRSVAPGALFACVPGRTADGHDHAEAALSAGASSLLCERLLETRAPQIVVRSVRAALGPVCDAFNGHPSRRLAVAGVTGTNGKTTTCALLSSMLNAAGQQATTIGTITHARTTPEAPELHAELAAWLARGGRALALEVSSHALAQHRADGVTFAAAVFTNLSPEHLDFHENIDAYFEAKARLFEKGRAAISVVNRDDEWGRRLLERIADSGGRAETFSLADATAVQLRPSGSTFTWRGQEMHLRLPGRFNVENALAAATTAVALGVEPASIAGGLDSVGGVKGRFQAVDAGQRFSVIVDYAHTPDGLGRALQTAREISAGRLIVVFGAGGDRDSEKRPLMGQVASRLADLAVLTSDNPRGEDPLAIIDAVLVGAGHGSNVVVEPDRASAIATALATARDQDVVVIAGKGHEQDQEVAGRVLPFDDVTVARETLLRIEASRRSGGGGR